MSPTISGQALRHLLAAANELQLDTASLAAAAGVDEGALGAEGVRVPLSTLHALWEATAQSWPQGDLVPRVVRCVSVRSYGVLGFLCQSASTVGAALHDVLQTLKLYTDEPRLEATGGRIRVRYTRPLTERPGLWRATESTLAEVLSTARFLTGQELAPLAVSFAHAAPADVGPLDAFFGVTVNWEASESSLELSPAQLALPLESADEQLHALLLPVARAALARCAPGDSVVERTRHALGGCLSEGAPTVSQVARKLSMSERTLRRRLAQEGLGFKHLLEQTRAQLARDYVANPQVPLAEVSYALGFSEPSAFHRAFKRWTGKTPARFRGVR